MAAPIKILFLCTGNACRSQIAEGWGKALGGSDFVFQSAGIEAHGKNPRAIQIMQQAGVDIASQASTKVTDEMLAWADWIVTVCGHADEHCPALPSSLKKEHWPLSDPAAATGSEADITAVFADSCADIKSRVSGLLARLGAAALEQTRKDS